MSTVNVMLYRTCVYSVHCTVKSHEPKKGSECCAVGVKSIAVFSICIKMAAIDENPVKQSLLKAIRKGQASKVTEILKQNPKFTADETLDAAQNRLLHKAARYGKVNVVQTLLTSGADVNGENKFHMTAMHHAAVEGSAEVIEALIEAGAKVNHPDNAKRLPLHWTCAYGHLEATK